MYFINSDCYTDLVNKKAAGAASEKEDSFL